MIAALHIIPSGATPTLIDLGEIGMAIGGFGLLWSKVLGPFMLRPLGRVIRHEIDEVVAKRLEPVEHAQDLASEAIRTVDQLVRRHNATVDRRQAELERRLEAVEAGLRR